MRTGPRHSRPIRRVNRNQPVARRRQALFEFVGNESVRALMGTRTMSVFANRMLASAAASLMICGGAGIARAQTSTPAETAPTVLPETKVASAKASGQASEADSARGVPRRRDPASNATAALAGRSARSKEQHLRSVPQQSLYDRRHDLRHDQPRYHPGSAARRPTSRSRKCCCRLPGSRRIPPPAACCMSATITPTSSSGSTG